MAKKNFYKIGLGNPMLRRTRIIFSVAIFLCVVIISAILYTGIASGELKKTIMTPITSLAKRLQTIVEYSVTPNSSYDSIDTTTTTTTTETSNTTVIINDGAETEENTDSPRQVYRTYPTSVPRAPVNTTSQADIDEWWANAHEENAQKSLESQKRLEEFKAASEKRMEDAKAEADKGMEEFNKTHGGLW